MNPFKELAAQAEQAEQKLRTIHRHARAFVNVLDAHDAGLFGAREDDVNRAWAALYQAVLCFKANEVTVNSEPELRQVGVIRREP